MPETANGKTKIVRNTASLLIFESSSEASDEADDDTLRHEPGREHHQIPQINPENGVGEHADVVVQSTKV